MGLGHVDPAAVTAVRRRLDDARAAALAASVAAMADDARRQAAFDAMKLEALRAALVPTPTKETARA